MKHSRLTLSALLITTMLSTTGCIIHVGAHENDGNKQYHANKQRNSHDTVFGGIEIEQNHHVENLSSVNGGIELADGVIAKNVETVNGGIEIGNNVQVKRASTVNGGIEAGSNLTVEKGLSTVNGGIHIGKNSSIDKDISTVNGDIKLTATFVGDDVKTKNGDISLLNGSIIEGDIIYESKDKDSWWKNKESSLPKLTIDNASNVKGRIILGRKVILEIEDDILLAKVERRYGK